MRSVAKPQLNKEGQSSQWVCNGVEFPRLQTSTASNRLISASVIFVSSLCRTLGQGAFLFDSLLANDLIHHPGKLEWGLAMDLCGTMSRLGGSSVSEGRAFLHQCKVEPMTIRIAPLLADARLSRGRVKFMLANPCKSKT